MKCQSPCLLQRSPSLQEAAGKEAQQTNKTVSCNYLSKSSDSIRRGELGMVEEGHLL